MEEKVIQNPALVCALDIGSTYSGYAWQWRANFLRDRHNIEVTSDWGGNPMQWHKTTTCILLDKTYNVHSIGFKAEKKFCQLCDVNGSDEILGNWYFFKHFKMVLYRENYGEDFNFEDAFGQILPMMDVLSKFIGALSSHFLVNLSKKNLAVDTSKILWVLTVPAIWSEASKRFMRDAAEMSGIQRENLLLALEPEAAAIYCLLLPADEREVMADLGNRGDKFVVADLGGCTADVMAVEVMDDGRVHEIAIGEGAKAGGQGINDAFMAMCQEIFSKSQHAWAKYWKENQSDLLEMESDFERAKVNIGSSDDDEDIYMTLKIPPKLMLKIDRGEIICNPSEGFKKEDGKFMFNSGYIRENLFRVTTEMATEPLIDVLRKPECSAVKKVIVVGGFAESVVVRRKIEEILKLKNIHVQIYTPTSPLYAVMKGAVLYGHDPHIFQCRVSRFTYGVKISNAYDEKVHPITRRERTENGDEIVRKAFSVHVRKCQLVRLGERQVSITYIPIDRKQKNVTVSVYSSTSENPDFVDEPECCHLADIRIDMTSSRNPDGNEQDIEVTMIYGGTELVVEAHDTHGDNVYDATIKFC